MKFERVFAWSDQHIHGFDHKKDKIAKEILADRLRWCDAAVVVGDHWERHAMPYEQLSKSPWAEDFSLMRSKLFKLVGNHDPKEHYEDIPPFWLNISNKLRFISGGVPYVMVHGHEFDSASYLDKLLTHRVQKLMPHIKRLERYMLGEGTEKGRLAQWYKSWNDEQKIKFARLKTLPREWGVAAHTHMGEIDYATRYINTGQFPYTFLEIIRGEPILRKA